MADIVLPPYNENYPQMPDGGWQSTTFFELGWISGLYNVANKTISSIFGPYDVFTINADDPLNFDHLDTDTFTGESVGPIIYLCIWTVILIIFAIGGCCWCLCQKCCCCCRSNFKNGRNIDELQDTDPTYQLRPYYSERNSKKEGISVTVIVLSVIMAIWLIGFLIMILHTFASNDKTKDAIDQIKPDLDNAIDDIKRYISVTKSQMDYAFGQSSTDMSNAINDAVEKCPAGPSDPAYCAPIKSTVESQMGNTISLINNSSKILVDALTEVEEAIEKGKNELDGDFQDVINDANKALHWFFMLFNLLYCLIFGLVLVGFVLAAFTRGGGLKTAGFLVVRGAIVLMFIVGLFAIIQIIGFFLFGGIISEILCPAVRGLEAEPDTRSLHDVSLKQESGDSYKVPNVGKILRACRDGKSAYEAFELQNAYNIDNILDITKDFTSLPAPGDHATVKEIQDQVEGYAEFVRDSTKAELGKCKPVYNTINATISLFCEKITAPVTSYWFILQFVLPTFIFIIITGLFLERFA